MRRVIISHLPGLMVLAWATGCQSNAAPPPRPPIAVDVLTLEPTEVRDIGEYLGSLLSRDSVNVLPQVAGYVRAIHVRPGATVKAGDVLLEIDSRQETAALTSAQAQVASAAAQLELARQAAARVKALFEEGLATAEELERRRADVEAREAQKRAAEAQASQASVQLQFHAIRAAVSGVVGDVLVRLGDFVTPSQPLTSVAQSRVLEVTVAVPAHRARQLRLGAPVELLARDGNVLLTSEVFFIAPEASPRTQLVEVKALVENTVGLRASELVRVRVVYDVQEALQIPVLAVTRQSGQAFAFVVTSRGDTDVVERRPITLGALSHDSYVVLEGLHANDRIAISSLQGLRDGAPIQSKDAAEARARNPKG